MKNIFNLEEYYSFSKYSLIYIDKLINNKIRILNVNKKDFLEDLEISTTTYNRCKKTEQKIGFLLLDQLLPVFNIKAINCIDKNKIEKLLSDIYYNFYYKKEISNFEKEIDEYIAYNTVLNPILFLFKLLIKVSNYKSPKDALKQNIGLYQLIKENKDCFIDEIDDLLTLIEILFESNVEDIDKNFECSKLGPVIYQGLTTNAYNNDNFSLAIYYGEKAKKYFEQDLNIDRIASINLMLYVCYNAIGEYKYVYDNALKQYNYYLFSNPKNPRLNGTLNHFLVACLGLHRYDDVIDILSTYDQLTTKEYMILLVAYFNKNKQLYFEKLDYIIKNKNINDNKIKSLDNFLNNKCKLNYNELKKHNINKGLLYLLNKNWFKK